MILHESRIVLTSLGQGSENIIDYLSREEILGLEAWSVEGVDRVQVK